MTFPSVKRLVFASLFLAIVPLKIVEFDHPAKCLFVGLKAKSPTPLKALDMLCYKWCRRPESNRQPTDYKSVALPIEPLRQEMVGATGFEPVTSSVWRKRSPPELSTRPTKIAPLFEAGHFTLWWALMGSNHRPCAYQAHALTNWAKGPQAPKSALLI